MKYVVFHLRTCGLNPEVHSIIELSAIIEDTKNILPYSAIPKYQTLVFNDVYHGDPKALYMNAKVFEQIAEMSNKRSHENIITINMLALSIYTWLAKYIDTYMNDSNYMNDFDSFGKSYNHEGVTQSNKKPKLLINAGGKNFGVFQHRFLKTIPGFNDYISINHRFLEPSILFFEKEDESLPNSEECKKRIGLIDNNNYSNTSLQDCMDVITLFRNKLKY